MEIEGNLATYEFSDLLQWLAQGKRCGVLTVSDGGREYKLGFDQGRIDMSSSSDPQQRLDSYLHAKGVIDEATMARTERLREATEMKAGQVLVTLGAVTEAQLAQALREKTEEILCELLTWEQGSFAFDGGERTDATMVPICLEVTTLLLESMHRLDRQKGGAQKGPPTAVFKVPAIEGTAVPATDATQAIEGLALAEVLDPEASASEPSPPAVAPVASVAEEPPAVEKTATEVPADPKHHYAVMIQSPATWRRYAPYALVVLLSLGAGAFYLANIEASAEAVDGGPRGEPILFTRTIGPPTRPAPVVAVAPAVAPAPDVAAPDPAEKSDIEAALRQQYERELEELRRELEEARRLASGAAGNESQRPAPDDLPVDSMMRAAVAPRRKTTELSAEVVASTQAEEPVAVLAKPAPGPGQPPPFPIPSASAAVENSPPEELPVAAEPESAESGVAVPPAPSLEFVNPVLLARPTPRYPEAARRMGRGATVTLRVLIGVDGRVKEVERTGPKAGMGFDRAAETAALQSTWKPGTRDGEPTEMWADLRFEFKL